MKTADRRTKKASARERGLAALAILVIGAIAGAGACRKVASAFDCRAVCARYRDCIDVKYDVGQCQRRCRHEASADRGFEHKADACEGCLKGHSCMGATFDCAGQCLGVVP